MLVRHGQRVFGNALLVGSVALVVLLVQMVGWISERLAFASLTLLLLLYLWREVARLKQALPVRWLINPAVVCAGVFFFMGYCGTNILFFLPSEHIEFLGLVPDVSPAMVTHQYLVLFGAIWLFLGYWSPLAIRATRPHVVTRFQRKFLPRSDNINGFAVPLLLLVGTVVRLLAIKLGLFGYGGDSSFDHIAATSSFSQYLSLAAGAGKLALVLAALSYFSSGVRPKDSSLFWAALLVEMFFGFLSGFKSAVVLPLVIAGVCLYLRRGKIPKIWFVLAIAALFMAYAIIEPFRLARNERGKELSSVSEIINTLVEGMESGNSSPAGQRVGPTVLAIASRSNLSYIGSFGIEYADSYAELPPGSPAFLQDIFLAPLHALVPRFIWTGKPLGQLGLWYNQTVMGKSHFSSTAMGPFTYLYFAGGFLAVGIAFFFIGVLQRFIFLVLTPWSRLSGALVFVAMLSIVAIIDSSVNGMIINIIRKSIVIFSILFFCFSRKTKVE